MAGVGFRIYRLIRWTASRMRFRIETSELVLLLEPSVSMALSHRHSVASPLSVSAQTRWVQRSHTNTSLPASPESSGSKRYIHKYPTPSRVTRKIAIQDALIRRHILFSPHGAAAPDAPDSASLGQKRGAPRGKS